MSDEIQGQIRHWATLISGMLIMLGYEGEKSATETTVYMVLAGGFALFGMVWSWYSKRKTPKHSRINRGES